VLFNGFPLPTRCPRDISVFFLHRIRDFARRAQALPIGPVPTFFHGGAPQGAALPGQSCRA